MKRIFAIILLVLIVLSASGQTKTITKAQYRDKTLAMILGSIGGALTGYEYLNYYNTPTGFYAPGATQRVPKEPILCLPDDWFILLNGTLGGTTKDEYNYSPWIMGKGRINSDDDQHIDFFNQWLLNQYGLGISYEDIKHEWLAKQVSDFGGGEGAIEVMRDKNLMAPQCGHRDHGNSGHWLPECYIEHEMMGAAFPGMPNKAVHFAEKFSSITGEGEAVTWGYYWAAAHSVAFFETDIHEAVKRALGMLPANCRPRQMYDICVMLKNKYPNDWRPAVRELWNDHWSAPFAVGYDGIMMLSDVNNGTGFLSILYGNNDYIETLKISSLAGGDGDCTASSVMGLIGIIKGMAGTPQKFKDDIYDDGRGVWINDVANAFSIKKDFKIEWKYDELVDMYQQNAEMTIRTYGGVVSNSEYVIKIQPGTIPQITTRNWDFEEGTLNGWKTWTSGGTSSIWSEKQCIEGTKACFAGSGKYKGTIITGSNISEAKLFQTVTGLKPGATYKLEGRTNTAGGREARFYVENYGGPYKYASTWKGTSPFLYQYLYVTMGNTNTTLDVGLHAPASTNGGKWCSIDDLIIYEIENPSTSTRYEAEAGILKDCKTTTSPTSSGGNYVGWINIPNSSSVEFRNVMAGFNGEHIVRLNYANADGYATHKVFVNSEFRGLTEHSDTGPWATFSANFTDIFVRLNKGPNSIRIEANSGSADIDYIDLLSPYGSEKQPFADLTDGEVYRIIAKHSNKALTVSSGNINGSSIVQSSYTRSSSQHFKISKTRGAFSIMPVNSTQAVEVSGCGINNEDKVNLWPYWEGDCQQWAILDAGDGYFKIVNNKSGKALDVAGGSNADGTTVFQYDYLNGENQKWRFELAASPITSLPENSSETEIEVKAFPNPAKDKISLNTTTIPESIEIFNSLGQLELVSDNETTLEIGHLKRGVYMAKLKIGDLVKSIKVVKE